MRRTYYPNGQVRTDSSYVREFGNNGVVCASGIEYGYHEGRLTRLLHPTHLAGNARVDTFSYHPQTGELAMARGLIDQALVLFGRVGGRPAAVGDQERGVARAAAGGGHGELFPGGRHRPAAGDLEERGGERRDAPELARAVRARHVGAGHSLVGQSSDCTATYTGQNCVPVPWPGWNTGAWFQEAAKPQTVGSERYWLGSLSVEMRDASGLMYKRNRYYNPQTGQFTQPDPIGLAGGLNIYGFAEGDPVSYTDPYGLCAASQVQPAENNDPEAVCPGGLTHGEYYAREDGFSTGHTARSKQLQERYYARNTEWNADWVGCSQDEIRFTQRQVHVRIGEWPPVIVDRLTWQVFRATPGLKTRQRWELNRGNFAFYTGQLIAFGPEDRTVPAVGFVNCDNGMGHFFASSSRHLLYGEP